MSFVFLFPFFTFLQNYVKGLFSYIHTYISIFKVLLVISRFKVDPDPDPNEIFLINFEQTKFVYHFLPDLNIK